MNPYNNLKSSISGDLKLSEAHNQWDHKIYISVCAIYLHQKQMWVGGGNRKDNTYESDIVGMTRCLITT